MNFSSSATASVNDKTECQVKNNHPFPKPLRRRAKGRAPQRRSVSLILLNCFEHWTLIEGSVWKRKWILDVPEIKTWIGTGTRIRSTGIRNFNGEKNKSDMGHDRRLYICKSRRDCS